MAFFFFSVNAGGDAETKTGRYYPPALVGYDSAGTRHVESGNDR